MKILIPLFAVLLLILNASMRPAAKPNNSYASNDLWDDLSSTIRKNVSLPHTLTDRQAFPVTA